MLEAALADGEARQSREAKEGRRPEGSARSTIFQGAPNAVDNSSMLATADSTHLIGVGRPGSDNVGDGSSGVCGWGWGEEMEHTARRRVEHGVGMGCKVTDGSERWGKAEQRGVGVRSPKKDGYPNQSIIVHLTRMTTHTNKCYQLLDSCNRHGDCLPRLQLQRLLYQHTGNTVSTQLCATIYNLPK
jgi:hypothetical protein